MLYAVSILLITLTFHHYLKVTFKSHLLLCAMSANIDFHIKNVPADIESDVPEDMSQGF